jgi:DNA-binding CsgD family transcriptional regulator
LTEIDGQDERLASDVTVPTEAVAVGLIDTETATLTAGNGAFAELLARTPESLAGLPVEAFMVADRALVARSTMAAMRQGWVEFLEGEAEIQRSSGSVTVYSWSLPVGMGVPWTTVIGGGVPVAAGVDQALVAQAVNAGRVIIATLDHDWRVRDLATRSASLLSSPLGRDGTSRLHDIVHPADEEALATVLDRAAVESGSITAGLRLRGRSEVWLDARVTVSRLYGLASTPFVSVIGLAAAHHTVPEADRLSRLEAYVVDLGAEVRSAGGARPRSAAGFAELTGLTARQNDIVRRLVNGQRVEAIAEELFISPSTVRNHLSAVYRVLGVKSQSELIRHILSADATLGQQRT